MRSSRLRQHLAHLTPLGLALALPACASMGDASRITAPPPASPARLPIVCAARIGPEGHPLIIVDGRVVDPGGITLNPAEIDNVDVLKGAAAVARYGRAGKEGAVLIRTKGAASKG